MLSNLFIFKKTVLFYRVKASTFSLLVHPSSEKMKNHCILFVILILGDVAHHQRRRDLEFVIVVVTEGGYISNLFLTKKLFIHFFIKLLEAVLQKHRLSSTSSSLQASNSEEARGSATYKS